MINRRQNPAPAPERHPRSRGFVLVEAALVLLLLVLAAWLAIDLVGRAAQRRRCDRFVADLRRFSSVFERYARQPLAGLAGHRHGGALPPALAPLLRETNWFEGSPFGGTYEWVAPRVVVESAAASAARAPTRADGAISGSAATGTSVGSGASSATAGTIAAGGAGGGRKGNAEPALGMIALTAFAPSSPLRLTRADLLRIDQRIDDGNLARGRFRTGFNGWPVYTMGGK